MAITYACYNKGCLEDFLENIGFSSKLWKNTQSITMGSFIADQFKDQKNELIKSVLPLKLSRQKSLQDCNPIVINEEKFLHNINIINDNKYYLKTNNEFDINIT